jgi:integral membrane protein (TIGR01906 family)
MLDVKVLVKQGLNLLYALILLLLLLVVITIRYRWYRALYKGFSLGGWLLSGFVVCVLVFVALSFESLFTEFHRLFFTGDTWLFLYSDNLIRLFPMRFWQDCFIYIGGMSILFGVLFGRLFGRRKSA